MGGGTQSDCVGTVKAKIRFPAWAPPEAIEYLRDYQERAAKGAYGLGDPRRECPEMLHRLLTYEGMQRVWDALQSSRKPFPAAVFAASAGVAFCGPRGEARLTPAQHRAFLADVQKRSAELSKMLRGTHLDQMLISRLDLHRYEVGHAVWWRFSEILDSVASGARYFAAASASKRTHGEHARRAYFVRHLTGFFREYLGGPRRELVAIATAAAFPDSPISERQIQKIAP